MNFPRPKLMKTIALVQRVSVRPQPAFRLARGPGRLRRATSTTAWRARSSRADAMPNHAPRVPRHERHRPSTEQLSTSSGTPGKLHRCDSVKMRCADLRCRQVTRRGSVVGDRGQREAHARALLRRCKPNLASVRIDDLAGDREAKAAPAARARCVLAASIERLEDVLAVLARDS